MNPLTGGTTCVGTRGDLYLVVVSIHQDFLVAALLSAIARNLCLCFAKKTTV